MTTVDRILNLMETNNITAAQLTREISLTNGLVTQWKQGKQKPSIEALNKISKYFNVSLDYLVNGVSTNNEYTSDQQELLNLYSKLNSHEQELVLSLVRILCSYK